MKIEKKTVFDFWDNASCGEALYLTGKTKEHSAIHYSGLFMLIKAEKQ
jgi:hypothetical protein